MFQETKNVLRISSALKLMSVVDGGVILSSDIFLDCNEPIAQFLLL